MEHSKIISKVIGSLTTKFNSFVCLIEELSDLSTLSIDELHGSLLIHEQRMQGNLEEEQELNVAQ